LRVKIGIIGTGLIAREHAKAIAMTPGMALVAAADVAADRLQEFADAFGVARRYVRTEELVLDGDVDLVAIAIPPAFHEEAAVAALDAGKYVLCEKPLAATLASAARIAKAEARHPRHLATSYQLRYEPPFRRLIWLCRNGWIGEIESADVERHSYIPHAAVGGGGWWGSWSIAGGGALITQLIHELDLLLLIMGRPFSVGAQMDTRFSNIESEDWIEAELRFENGRKAKCTASVNSGVLRGSFTIKGNCGSAWPGGMALDDPGRQARALKAVNQALPETAPASASLPGRALRKITRGLGAAAPAEPTAHARLYHEIASCVRRGDPLPVPPAEALESLQVCAGAYQSAITGKIVELPLEPNAVAYQGLSKETYNARPRPHQRPPCRRTAPGKSGMIRVGLIGLDTSHAAVLTDLLHNPYHPEHIPGAKVVAAYPGGSPDMPISSSRVAGFTAELRNAYGVPIVDTPEAVAEQCDLIFVLSADGRTHPGLVRRVAGSGKPIFVDKPVAVSANDVERLFHTARHAGIKLFASSAFRYADGLVAALNQIRDAGEEIRSCEVQYWLQIQPTQGRYFWYGIHAAEMVMAIMGTGVSEVEAFSQADRDTIRVWHQDGRRSTLLGSQNDGRFAVAIETNRRTLEIDLAPSMGSLAARLLAAALDVLTEGRFPRLWRASTAGSISGRSGSVLDPDEAETLQVVRLVEAAERSFAAGLKASA
jgi:predicted dehydrogenase